MAHATLGTGRNRPAAPRSGDLWLVSPAYDLGLIILSAALAVLPHLGHAYLRSTILVDLGVTMLIGGPHLFATYTMTLMEPSFRRRYPRYTRAALLLPLIIVSLAAWDLTLLVTVFFFWASVHVIHQAAFVADAYRFKDPRGWSWTSRVIDYGLLLTAMYPIATSKLMAGGFHTGGRALLFPDVLRQPLLPALVWTGFIGFVIAFVVKTAWEIRAGRVHWPKTLHMAVAASLFLVTPTHANLDVAFEGLNVWHSFQYLAIVIQLNRLRQQRGYIDSQLVRRVAGRGYRLYGLCLAFTVGVGLLFLGVLGLVVRLGLFATGAMLASPIFGAVFAEQHYFAFYAVVLSFLLVHYYFDHFVFLSLDSRVTPAFAPLPQVAA
jgi:hypothetical protein